ncbi:50S ribosomal protein L25/general stress protein Ctc [Arcanobacterium haemolyticum]|nr:50S ribosomal protein L25/general stress protein Ctc [Arcanobacterium haemolyticum]
MSNSTNISALARTTFGKGASRQLRRDGRTPAVVYGHGADPIHLSFDAHDIFLATKGVANALLTVDLEGEEVLALVKDIQRNPLSRIIEHVDLLRVVKGEKVDVEVPVEVIGESAAGTIHTVEHQHLMLKASATNLPEVIKVDITGREEGAHITVADIEFPEGSECELDPETIVVVIAAPEVDTALEEADAAAAEAASEAAAAEAAE